MAVVKREKLSEPEDYPNIDWVIKPDEEKNGERPVPDQTYVANIEFVSLAIQPRAYFKDKVVCIQLSF